MSGFVLQHASNDTDTIDFSRFSSTAYSPTMHTVYGGDATYFS
jgi:hypothetical protein